MLESDIEKLIALEVSKYGAVTFRNNIGTAWQGELEKLPGQLIITKPRAITYGVCNPGGSDRIGWLPVEITMNMVGRKVAVFFAPETKGKNGRAAQPQRNFHEQVRAAGGIAGVCRSPEEAIKLLTDWRSGK